MMVGRPAAMLREGRGEPIALLALGLGIVVLATTSSAGVPASVHVSGVLLAAHLAVHAAGVVLVHRSHGFLNLGQVALGALGGVLFAVMTKADVPVRLVDAVCPPCLGPTPSPWISWSIALVLGLGLSSLVAFVFHVAVIRRFRDAPVLVPTVASLFLVQIVAGLGEPIANVLTTVDQRARGVLDGPVGPPTDAALDVLGLRVPAHDLVFLALAVALLVGAGVGLSRTAYGAALRASSERPERAQTLGVDVLRVHQRLWALIGASSGIATARAVMNGGLGVTDQNLVAVALVPILTVAVIARLRSLPMVVVGALLIGLLTTTFQWVVGSRVLLDGLMVVLVTVLLLVQKTTVGRTDQAGAGWSATRDVRPVSPILRDLPEVVRWRRIGRASLAVGLVALPWVLSPSQASLATTALLYAIVGLSLLVLTGWAGLVSLGQFAFAAVGGWVALVTGLPVLLALPVGAAAGGLVALLVGLPALRLRGLALAVSTLALAVTASLILVNPRYLGGLVGDIDRPSVLGLDLDDQRVGFYLALVVLSAAVVAVVGLRRSRTGRVLLASRENEVAAQSLGVSLVRARLTAFGISGVLAAAAGVLFAYQQGGVQPDSFSPDVSITIFAYVVIGGLGSVVGPLLGFALFGLVTMVSQTEWIVTLASGAGGLVLLLVAPGGLTELAVRARDAFLRRVAQRRHLRVPHLHELDDRERAPIAPRRSAVGGDDLITARWSLPGQWTMPASTTADADAATRTEASHG